MSWLKLNNPSMNTFNWVLQTDWKRLFEHSSWQIISVDLRVFAGTLLRLLRKPSFFQMVTQATYSFRWGKAAFRRLRRNSWTKTMLFSTTTLRPNGTVTLPISNRLNMYARIVACIVKPAKQMSFKNSALCWSYFAGFSSPPRLFVRQRDELFEWLSYLRALQRQAQVLKWAKGHTTGSTFLPAVCELSVTTEKMCCNMSV